MPGALGSARALAWMGDCACQVLSSETLKGQVPCKETWALLPTNALWCTGNHLHEVPVYTPARLFCLVVEDLAVLHFYGPQWRSFQAAHHQERLVTQSSAQL